MPTKFRLFAASAAVLLMVSVGAAGAGAATPLCGPSCIELSSALYGASSTPTFVLADARQVQRIGQPLTLARPSNSNQGEDFTVADQGTVELFIHFGIIATGMSLYNTLEAFEIEYAPFGADSGLCVGVLTTPANGTGVVLAPCGANARTLWIIDTQLTGVDLPLINGATGSNFSDPSVLTALGPGFPLFTSQMHVSSGGLVFANQLWGSRTGVLP